MPSVVAVLSFVSWVSFIGLAVEPLFVGAMFGALSSVRIRSRPDRLVLTSLDGIPFGLGLGSAAGVSVLVWAVGSAFGASKLSLFVVSAALFVGAFGCRVRLVVGRGSTECVRSLLWVVPWRRARFGRAIAWVDGWGDMADPLAFHIGEVAGDRSPGGGGDGGLDEQGLFSLELGWASQTTETRADPLARDFNRAVAELYAVRE